MKKLMLVLILLVACGVCSAADNNWVSTGGTGQDNLWSTPANWSLGWVPLVTDGQIHISTSYPLNTDMHVVVGQNLEINGSGAIVNLQGGFNLTAILNGGVGVGETNSNPATLNIKDGGTVTSKYTTVGLGKFNWPAPPFAGGVGIVNIIDGALVTGPQGFNIGAEREKNTGCYGRVNVYPAGTLTVGNQMKISAIVDNDAPKSYINLSGGIMTLKPYTGKTLAQRLTDLQDFVDVGKIRGYGGSRDVDVYDDGTDAFAVALDGAGDPFYFVPTPADGGFVLPVVPLTLSWLLPAPIEDDAISVNVIWGTDAAGNGGTPILTGAPDALTVDVTTALAETTIYYWKIVATDPVTDAGTPVVYESAVFSVSTNREPEIAANSMVYQWLEEGTRTVGITSDVNDLDGIALHTYTWSSDPAGVTFSPNGTNDANDTDATFTTAGEYTLQVEVNDNDEHFITNTVTVTVYADGCAAVTNEGGYDAAAARERGDFNHNCEADLWDLQQLALVWLESKALKY